MDEALLAKVLARPGAALRRLKKKDAEESLLAFVRLTWHVIEPKRRFVEGWALHAIVDHLEAIHRGEFEKPKLLISCPPGMSKSLLTCVFFPAWEWGPRNRPDLRYICASYSDKLSRRDSRRCRRLIQSPIYQELWGDRFQLEADQNAVERFGNDHTGWRLATSVRGLGTGERGDRFIIDDALSVKDAESDAVRRETRRWFCEVTGTRINDPEDGPQPDEQGEEDDEGAKASAFLAIGQRVHVADISGLILKSLPGWTHLCMPMEFERNHPFPSTSPRFKDPRTEEGELLFPERFSRRYIDEDLKPTLMAEGGSYAVAAQLQQRPVPREGGMFQKQWFKPLSVRPAANAFRIVVRGWDLAASKGGRGARTAGVLIGITIDKRIVIMDADVGRLSPGEAESRVKWNAEHDAPLTRNVSLPQDPGQAGVAQKEAFARLLHGFNVHVSPETGTKEDRAKLLAAQAELGNVYVVDGPWVEEYIREMTEFPNGDLADQVDASSRGYAYLVQNPERAKTSSGGRIIE